jgi:hypothetical protein
MLLGLLAGTFVLASLRLGQYTQKDLLSIHLDRYWFHFLTYVSVSILSLLVWRRRTGLMLGLEMAVLFGSWKRYSGLS